MIAYICEEFMMMSFKSCVTICRFSSNQERTACESWDINIYIAAGAGNLEHFILALTDLFTTQSLESLFICIYI